jgi:hypothetical protein
LSPFFIHKKDGIVEIPSFMKKGPHCYASVAAVFGSIANSPR